MQLNLSIELTERRTLGSKKSSLEAVVTVVGKVAYNINYPIGNDESEVKKDYPKPYDFLSFFHIDELSGLQAYEFDNIELIAFEELYSAEDIAEFHQITKKYLGQLDSGSIYDIYRHHKQQQSNALTFLQSSV